MTGQEEIFNGLVRDYSERLYWHIRGIVGSHEDADDLVQESFMKAWQGLPSFRGESSEFTWLWRIATNEALNFLRRQRLRSFLSLTEPDVREAMADPWFNGDEAQSKLAGALSKLPSKQRLVFSMRYWEELPYEQIAAITGTSVGALKASYHIAFEKIKAFLSETD